jgi:hypothetical protein
MYKHYAYLEIDVLQREASVYSTLSRSSHQEGPAQHVSTPYHMRLSCSARHSRARRSTRLIRELFILKQQPRLPVRSICLLASPRKASLSNRKHTGRAGRNRNIACETTCDRALNMARASIYKPRCSSNPTVSD